MHSKTEYRLRGRFQDPWGNTDFEVFVEDIEDIEEWKKDPSKAWEKARNSEDYCQPYGCRFLEQAYEVFLQILDERYEVIAQKKNDQGDWEYVAFVEPFIDDWEKV